MPLVTRKVRVKSAKGADARRQTERNTLIALGGEPDTAPVLRVVLQRHSSGADVVLALIFSMLFVTLSLVSFSMFCWNAAIGAVDLGGIWLFAAVMAFLFAKLIAAFAELLKTRPEQADELRTDGLCDFSTTQQ